MNLIKRNSQSKCIQRESVQKYFFTNFANKHKRLFIQNEGQHLLVLFDIKQEVDIFIRIDFFDISTLFFIQIINVIC